MVLGETKTEIIGKWKRKPGNKQFTQVVRKTLIRKNPERFMSRTEHVLTSSL
jgi:hypothetical protein